MEILISHSEALMPDSVFSVTFMTLIPSLMSSPVGIS